MVTDFYGMKLIFNHYWRKFPIDKRFGTSLVKSISILPGICWCGRYYKIQYSIKNDCILYFVNISILKPKRFIAQSAGAVEYTDWI